MSATEPAAAWAMATLVLGIGLLGIGIGVGTWAIGDWRYWRSDARRRRQAGIK